MHAALGLSRVIDGVTTAIGRSVIWLIFAAILISAINAVTRKLWSLSSNSWLEAQWYLFGAAFMLGAAYTLQRKGHVRTDSFYANWSPRRQALVDLVGYLVMAVPVAAVFAFVGWGYFVKAWTTNETFVSSAWQPITWPFKLMMPVTGVLLLVQIASECCKCLHTLQRGQWPDAPEGVQ